MKSPADPGADCQAALEAAIAIHRAGRIDEAEPTYRRILAEQPDNAEALHMLGVVHLQKQLLNDALSLFKEAISRNGDDARYHNNLGNALMGLGRREEAISAFRQALAVDPNFLIARCNCGFALFEAQRFSEAAHEYAAVLDEDPGNRAALTNFGVMLMKQGRFSEAERYFRRGLESSADDLGLLFNLGIALERLNQSQEAETIARRALELNPTAAEPHFLLARLDKRAGRLVEASRTLKSLLSKPLRPELETDAWFDLGQVLDRTGEFDQAIAAFSKANSKQVAAQRPEPDDFPKRVEANRRAFTHDRFPPNAPRSSDPGQPPPVFFVGFPRSGTTLMERALAAHPGIVTTEEDSPLARLVDGIWKAGNYLTDLNRLSDDDLDGGRAAFWSQAEKAHGSIRERQLVDKMPLNIINLGYANLLFPDGRAVVALRDPRDVCLSCFMQRFKLDDAMRIFADFGDTVRFYVAVMDLWMHQREFLSLPWIEYRYEDLVGNVEKTVGEVLSFMGLDWHPDIDGYRQLAMQQPIRTPSYQEVTSPVYSRAVGRWRNYRTLLDPHLDVLQPYISALGYPAD